MNKILIRNIYHNGIRKDILIEGNKIAAIVDAAPAACSDEKVIESMSDSIENSGQLKVIDGKGKAIIPGFANMHTHAAMTLMRGTQEDVNLKHWLKAIWKQEKKLDDELVYWGTKLACVEMIKTGTTCYNDQYWRPDSAVKAASEIGLRSWHSYVFLDAFNKKKAALQRDECQAMVEEAKKWKPITRFTVSVHAPYTVSAENIKWASEFARNNNLILHIHIAETGQERLDSLRKHHCNPVEYLDKMGIFGPNIVAAHCVWIDEKGIATLGRNKVNVVHNINSNLKLASGYKFKFKELADAGANVCIGTDGCASSNNLDMLEAVKTSALVQKAWRKDPMAIPLSQLFKSATLNGYKALGLNGGLISVGALADVCLIDIDNYAFTPNVNFLANLIYSAHSDCVDTVICDGKILMQNRKIRGEENILNEVRRLYKKILL